MAGTLNAPYGLKPVKRADGQPYSGAVTEYLIDPAGEATNIYYGQVVILGADGYIALATASGADATTNNLGGSTIGALGVFVGCEYTNSEGQQVFSQYYPSGQTYNSTPIRAKVVDDPNVIFKAQLDATAAQTIVGLNTTFAAVQSTSTGSTTTGNSTSALDADGSTAVKPFRILGFTGEGAAGTDYPEVYVAWHPAFHRATYSAGLGL